MVKIVAPSILSCDFSKLREEVTMLNKSFADWIHVDVMDGLFVPNISFGDPVIKALKKYAEKPLDIHLMIEQPSRYIGHFCAYQPEMLTIHYEASTHLHRDITEIKKHGVKVGIAINPHTNVFFLEDIISEIDLVCIMGVNPGFGGQNFIKQTYQKVEQLRSLVDKSSARLFIEVDGGITLLNAKALSERGVNVFVTGSTVFSSQVPEATIAQIKKAVTL